MSASADPTLREANGHWTLEAVLDPPGSFDYSRGSYPAGHPTMIDHI
jgi:hypothetical protein